MNFEFVIFVMKSWISLFLGGLTHFLENMHSRQTTLPGSLYWCSNVMMVTFREHEINSHIGSGYDLWRNDNVTRDGEGLYRLYIVWDHIRNDCTIYIQCKISISYQTPLKHFPVGGGNKQASYFPGQLLKALVRHLWLPSMQWRTIHNHHWPLYMSRYVQLSFTAVHPPYQAPEKFLRLHTQVWIKMETIIFGMIWIFTRYDQTELGMIIFNLTFSCHSLAKESLHMKWT